jgi:hypothetical protein
LGLQKHISRICHESLPPQSPMTSLSGTKLCLGFAINPETGRYMSGRLISVFFLRQARINLSSGTARNQDLIVILSCDCGYSPISTAQPTAADAFHFGRVTTESDLWTGIIPNHRMKVRGQSITACSANHRVFIRVLARVLS